MTEANQAGGEPGAESGQDADRALLARLNAEARAGAVTETLHGVAVQDPYRSLEEDTPETRAWIDAQSERASQMLSTWGRPDAAARLRLLVGHTGAGSLDRSRAIRGRSNPRD